MRLGNGPWILSRCENGTLKPVDFSELHSTDDPVHLTCLGKSQNLLPGLVPEHGAYYLALAWPEHKDVTVHEAAPFIEVLLLRHVPQGSRVLFCSLYKVK